MVIQIIVKTNLAKMNLFIIISSVIQLTSLLHKSVELPISGVRNVWVARRKVP